MKRANSQGLLVRYQYPQKLIKWRESFSSYFTPIQPADDPLEPFMTVTDDVLSVRDAKNKLRFSYLLPLVIGLWILAFTFSSNLGPNSASLKTAKERVIEYQLKDALGESFDSFDEQWSKYYGSWFNSDGEYSFINYSEAVLTYGSQAKRKSFIAHLIIASVTLSLAAFFTVFFIRTPKPANIYFDRKRQIVYT
ncbi:hypothetical protein MD535_25305, partial [Vibrio sp. ZSDZ65]